MLAYQNIYQVGRAQDRLKRLSNYRWSQENNEEADRLTVFTFGTQAQEDSEHNLKISLEMGRRHGAKLMVIHPYKVQYVGQSNTEALSRDLFPLEWCQEYTEWLHGSPRTEYQPTVDQSNLAEVLRFDTHRECLVQRGHHGVYDVESGVRIKNRREIIQRIWDYGFATWRGRPPSIAKIRWSGDRQELTELAELADRYWNRRYTSDVGTKIVSAYRSINRYAAWPGAW